MRRVLTSLAMVGLMGGLVLAQQPGQPGGQRVAAQPGQQGQQGHQAGTSDQQIAAKIFGGCHNEVELAKFVQSKLQSPEAKQFAAKMIKDHTPDCEAYQKFAGNLVSHQPHGNNPNASQRAAGGQANWVSIHNELAQKCLETVKEELGKKSGKELDQCYMMHQAMAHTQMKDCLTVLKGHASQQLAQQIAQSLEGVEGHLKEAKQIIEQMDDHPAERVTRRNEGSK